MLARDFNITVDPNGSSNPSNTSVANSNIRDFVDCKIQLLVFDHIYAGPTFTWTNKHFEGFIAKKLDRVL